MDVKEFISTGILESYVLGLASEAEIREVQSMLKLHPELNAELEAIEEALISHASLQANPPSAGMKERVERSLFGSEARVISMDAIASRKSSFYKFAAAAVVLLFLLSISANIFLYRNLQQTRHAIAELNREKSQLAREFQVQKAVYETQLQVLNSPDIMPVRLKGMTLSPASMAMVFWNKQTHEVFIKTNALPQPPAGHGYQLWALDNGKPVNAGMVQNDTNIQKMQDIGSAQAFAVTLEQAGGSVAPTLTAMYLMGEM